MVDNRIEQSFPSHEAVQFKDTLTAYPEILPRMVRACGDGKDGIDCTMRDIIARKLSQSECSNEPLVPLDRHVFEFRHGTWAQIPSSPRLGQDQGKDAVKPKWEYGEKEFVPFYSYR